MPELMTLKVFNDDSRDHQEENLSYTLFADFDYSRQETHKTSFRRSDFTRSRISNVKFFDNDFDRADIIDAFVVNSVFKGVNFGICLIDNTVFDSVEFSNNSYTGSDIKNSRFDNCRFTDESITANMSKCIFKGCSFINFDTNRSTLSDNSFINCTFNETDMSECIAERSEFLSCKMAKTFLCATHWATYTFRNTTLSEILFKYRGRIVDVWNSDEELGFQHFLAKEKYFEYINSLVFVGTFEGNDQFPTVFAQIFKRSTKLYSQVRQRTLINLIGMLKRYCGSPLLGYDALAETLNYLRSIDFGAFPLDEEFEYYGALCIAQRAFLNLETNYAYVLTIPVHRRCEVLIRLDCESKKDAISYAKKLFTQCSLVARINAEDIFVCTKVSRGSIVLTVSSYLILGVLLVAAIGKCAGIANKARIEWATGNKLIELISKTENIQQLESVAGSYCPGKPNLTPCEDDLAALSDMVLEGEIISVIVKPLGL